MSDRSTTLASGGGVCLAVIGSAANSVVLSVLGPLLALAVHLWTEYRAAKMKRQDAEVVAHLKFRNYVLEQELAKLRGSVPTPPAVQP